MDLHREGEPGEAAPPGDRLRQPHGGAAVLGEPPEDAVRGERVERVSGGRVGLRGETFTCFNDSPPIITFIFLDCGVPHLEP